MTSPSQPPDPASTGQPVDDHAVQRIAEIVAALEAALIAVVTARLAVGLALTPAAWVAARLVDAPLVRRAATTVIGQYGQHLVDAIHDAVGHAYRGGIDQADKDLAGDTDILTRPVITDTTTSRLVADDTVRTIWPLIQDLPARTEQLYRDAVNAASARALAGQPVRMAAQDAWAALVDRGVTGYTDRAGRRWRLHTYTEMAVRTAVAEARRRAVLDECQARGQTLVVVPGVAGSCDECRPWQGAVLAIDGATGDITVTSARTGKPITVHVAGTVGEARAAGLWHPNCRHGVRAFVPGVSRPDRSVVDDPALGMARARQRALERNVRRWRERAAAAITPDGKRSAVAHAAEWTRALEAHLTSHPRLKRLLYRERPGAGHVPPAKRRGGHPPY